MTSKPSRILLVDDDPATRIGLAELLTDAGYETRALATFEEGLRALRTETPDLLIADVRLGAFNGLQLLVSSPRTVPAIIITGFADPVLESDARQHGAEYVLKPVTPSLLVKEIPVVLRADFYAVAALAGAAVVVVGHLLHWSPVPTTIAGASVCLFMRLTAIRRGWRLPVANEDAGDSSAAP